MALAVYYFVIRANQIQVQEEKKQSLNEVVANFAQELSSTRKDITLLSNASAVGEYLRAASQNNGKSNEKLSIQEKSAKNVLGLFFEQNPYYLQISLVDEKGQERIKFSKLTNKEELRSVTKDPYFRRTLVSQRTQTPVKEIQDGKFATVFAHSIYNEKFVGMIVLYLDAEIFKRSMRPLLKSDLSTFLFDDRGIVFAATFKSNEVENLLGKVKLDDEAAQLLGAASFDSRSKSILDGKTTFLLSFLPSESIPRVSTYEAQNGENWFLGVLQPDEAVLVSGTFQMVFFSILLLAIGAVFFAANKAAHRITIPLEKVSAATGEIARGNSDLNLDVKTGDEVEDLAIAITKMNDELRDYQKQIVQSAKLATMGEMTSSISHEIQNRISGVSLWLQHLDSEMDSDDPRQEYLNEMKLGLSGFMTMLSDLKRYYQKPVLDLNGIDFNLLITKTLPFAQENVDKKDVEIKTELYANLPKINGDQEKLKSVALNLILNAVDAVEKGGKIEIETALDVEKGETYLTVRDNGKGIDEKDLAQIFYPFYSTKSGGSGLGLAISSNIIAAHKGRIEVESEIGKGTTFKVVLRIERTEELPANYANMRE